MRIKDYLDEILNIIAKHPFAVSQSISFEERPPDTAFITGLITFTNGSKLHFKEFVVFETAGFKILKYGYRKSEGRFPYFLIEKTAITLIRLLKKASTALITQIMKNDYTGLSFRTKRGISALRFFGLCPQNDGQTVICEI